MSIVMRLVCGLFALVVLNACQGISGVGTLPAAPRSRSVDSAANCNPAEARQLVQRFIDTFNSGDTTQLDLIWSKSSFEWYSTDAPGKRINAEAYDRSNLMGYFAQRHAQHETLVLQSFRFNGNSAALAGFEFTLIRRADGLNRTPYVGKGAIYCSKSPRTIALWSMAQDPSPFAGIEWIRTLVALAAGLVIVAVVVLVLRRRLGHP